MLCAACTAIFNQAYLLGSNAKIEWENDVYSFDRTRTAGCQICNFLWTKLSKILSDVQLNAKHFPFHYSFKLHSADWARFGREPEYLEIQVAGEATEEFAEERAGMALSRRGAEYTVHALRYLLKKDCGKLLRGEVDIWVVLAFEAVGNCITFPLRVSKGHEGEALCQVRISEQNTTGSTETLQLGLHWLSECISNHPECKTVYGDTSWHPFRLIFVGTCDDPSLRLTLGSELPSDIKYAALSYCWGHMKHPIATKDTLAEFYSAIPLEALPRTARDAVHVTRALGLQYLWIDCLCIMKNDEEEWYAQCAQMAKVYGYATCTIAAASSESGTESFLSDRNQYAARPCEVPNPFSKESDLAFQVSVQPLGSMFDEEVRQTVWHNRGWVFQERLLSQRLLIFGPHQIMWACQRQSAAESWPSGRSNDHHIDRFESFEAEKREFHRLLHPERVLGAKDEIWESIVQKYTVAALSKPSDRLIALQGIATRVSDATGRVYSSGLWLDSTLPQSLLWRLKASMIGPLPKLTNTPSWSWGSVTGPVEFLDDQTEIVKVLIERSEPLKPMEDLRKAATTLKLVGPLFELTLAPHSSKRYFHLRRDGYVELQKRLSLRPPSRTHLSVDPPDGEPLSRRRRTLMHLGDVRREVSHKYKKTVEVLRPQIQMLRKTWLEKVWRFVEEGYSSTRPLWGHVYSKYINRLKMLKAPALWLWSLCLLSIYFLIWSFEWALENKYTGPLLLCLGRIVKVLYLVFTAAVDFLWSPIRWIGYKIHGDPQWDWILLWNLTAPFPYFCPSIFGPLRKRPPTALEWRPIRAPDLTPRLTNVYHNHSYEEWRAAIIPNNPTPFIDAECWLDGSEDLETDIQVKCLVILQRCHIHGLLLQPIPEQKMHYRRIGYFKSSKHESCFASSQQPSRVIFLE